MTAGSSLSTASACSAPSTAIPSPLIAIVSIPRRRASATKDAISASGRPCEIASAMSSGRAKRASVEAPVGWLLGAIAGSARLPTITGCMNSTAACAASVAAAPFPKGISVPPRAKHRAIAWQARARPAASRSKSSRTTRSRSAIRSSSAAGCPVSLSFAIDRSLDPARLQLRELLFVGLAEHLQELAGLAGLLLVDLRHSETDVDQDPIAHPDRFLAFGEQAEVDVAPNSR